MKQWKETFRKIVPKLLGYLLYGLIIGGFILPLASLANEPMYTRIIWDKRPIAVSLSVGEERLVHFPSDVRYWVPESIRDRVSILSANGVVYLTALVPFDRTRIRVQSLETHTMYLLDVDTHSMQTHHTDVVITDADFVGNEAKDHAPTNKKGSGDWFVRLTRFAAQSLYAPERLHPVDREIHTVRLTQKQSIPLIRGGFIEATPIRSWRGGGYTITAIKLRNLTSEPIDIVHEANQAERAMNRLLVLNDDVRGEWLALTAQHRALAPRGNSGAVTTLYVISSRSFDESKERF